MTPLEEATVTIMAALAPALHDAVLNLTDEAAKDAASQLVIATANWAAGVAAAALNAAINDSRLYNQN